MRWALVGSGPGAPRFAREIDACDVVIRINCWPRGEAGDKWDVWASPFQDYMVEGVLREVGSERVPGELWFTIPEGLPDPCADGRSWGRARKLAADADNCQVLRVAPELYSAVGRAVSDEARRAAAPTTGFVALRMALEQGPDELVLAGFDSAVSSDRGRWGPWYGQRMYSARWFSVHHDFPAEDRLIERWLRSREFCGHTFAVTRPVWLRCGA